MRRLLVGVGQREHPSIRPQAAEKLSPPVCAFASCMVPSVTVDCGLFASVTIEALKVSLTVRAPSLLIGPLIELAMVKESPTFMPDIEFEPVARMMFFAASVCFAPSAPVTSTFPGKASRPVPLNTVTLFFFIRYSMPLVFFKTILFLRFCTSSKAS